MIDKLKVPCHSCRCVADATIWFGLIAFVKCPICGFWGIGIVNKVKEMENEEND
jgi:hypothetical protein